MQNLSAGLLIGALLAEIYPMLHERLGSDGLELTSISSAFLGFVLALGLMYYLHSLEHGSEEKVSEGPEAPPVLERMATAQMVKLQAGNSSLNMAIGGLHKMQEAEGDMDVETRLHSICFGSFLSSSAIFRPRKSWMSTCTTWSSPWTRCADCATASKYSVAWAPKRHG